ncbi:MAG: protein kinase [Polyangiaceae bacterium]|nr:protein kinase [Polyangiaceae bacterium]
MGQATSSEARQAGAAPARQGSPKANADEYCLDEGDIIEVEESPIQTLRPGAMLTPSIQLVRPLGDGGMASLWVAEHKNLGIRVAVKLLNESMRTLPSVRKRFLEEGPVAARIKSLHVVHIFDRGMTKAGVPFIVMELLEGETIQERIDRQQSFSVLEARAVLTQTARALVKVHAAGLVHCDVKPDNLFLVEGEGELSVKLLDFGIARRIGEVDNSGFVLGTPAFMAPEQAIAWQPLGIYSDVWSLAVVVYLLLTGRVPFEADTLEEAGRRLSRRNFTPVTSLRPDLPSDLDGWFSRALSPDPRKRFTTMGEMISSFDRALQLPDRLIPRPMSATLTELERYLPPEDLRATIRREDLDATIPRQTPIRVQKSDAPVVHDVPVVTPAPVGPPRRTRWILPVLAATSVATIAVMLVLARSMTGAGRMDTARAAMPAEAPAVADGAALPAAAAEPPVVIHHPTAKSDEPRRGAPSSARPPVLWGRMPKPPDRAAAAPSAVPSAADGLVPAAKPSAQPVAPVTATPSSSAAAGELVLPTPAPDGPSEP